MRNKLRARFVTLPMLLATVLFASASPRLAMGQQLGEGMQRSGTVGIQSETERQLFAALICTCGCPREALSTCTCGFAHERRAELRAELAKGRPMEDIKKSYAARFGSQALAVPPNVGPNKLLWALPLFAIAVGGLIVSIALRRWRRTERADHVAPTQRSPTDPGGARDAYDDKLDDELKELDE